MDRVSIGEPGVEGEGYSLLFFRIHPNSLLFSWYFFYSQYVILSNSSQLQLIDLLYLYLCVFTYRIKYFFECISLKPFINCIYVFFNLNTKISKVRLLCCQYNDYCEESYKEGVYEN